MVQCVEVVFADPFPDEEPEIQAIEEMNLITMHMRLQRLEREYGHRPVDVPEVSQAPDAHVGSGDKRKLASFQNTCEFRRLTGSANTSAPSPVARILWRFHESATHFLIRSMANYTKRDERHAEMEAFNKAKWSRLDCSLSGANIRER